MATFFNTAVYSACLLEVSKDNRFSTDTIQTFETVVQRFRDRELYPDSCDLMSNGSMHLVYRFIKTSSLLDVDCDGADLILFTLKGACCSQKKQWEFEASLEDIDSVIERVALL
jgi:hypothetical protein